MSAPDGFTFDRIDFGPITEEIKGFTVSLGVDRIRNEISEITLVGSGTLVAWKGKIGILTASHVIEEGNIADAAVLRLAGNEGEVWEIDVSRSNILTIGQYSEASASDGPDIAVIELPQADSRVQLLKARKSFYNLEKEPGSRIEIVKDDCGLLALSGTLGETRSSLGISSGVDGVRYDGFVGYCSHRVYFSVGEYDYFDVTVRYDPEILPESYGGMSGGGLWKIPVFQEPDGEVTTRSALLAGVNFYQFSPDAPDRGKIRCHGVNSVYKIASPQNDQPLQSPGETA